MGEPIISLDFYGLLFDPLLPVSGDSSAEPASMEEIQAAIEEAQKQYRERLQYHRQQQEKGVETDLIGNSLDVRRSHVR